MNTSGPGASQPLSQRSLIYLSHNVRSPQPKRVFLQKPQWFVCKKECHGWFDVCVFLLLTLSSWFKAVPRQPCWSLFNKQNTVKVYESPQGLTHISIYLYSSWQGSSQLTAATHIFSLSRNFLITQCRKKNIHCNLTSNNLSLSSTFFVLNCGKQPLGKQLQWCVKWTAAVWYMSRRCWFSSVICASSVQKPWPGLMIAHVQGGLFTSVFLVSHSQTFNFKHNLVHVTAYSDREQHT